MYKIEACRLGLQAETIDLAMLLHDTAATARPLAERNGNSLVVEHPDGIGMLYADPVRVRQVLLNLLSNGCKVTENGEVRLTAAREHRDDGEWVGFDVHDTGTGAAPGEGRNGNRRGQE